MTQQQSIKTIPGPRGWPLSGNLYRLKKDILQCLLDDREKYGAIVKYRIGHFKYIALNNPAYIRQVLLENKDNYTKQTLSNEQSKYITGDSLLTLYGDRWHQQRRRMQGTFRKTAVASYFSDMVLETNRYIDRWQQHADNKVSITREMSALTYAIVGKALFGLDMDDSNDKIQESLDIALNYIHSRIESLIRLPLWGYTPKQRAFKNAIKQFDSVVHNMIEQRSQDQTPRNDLLGKLLAAVDEEDNTRMSREQVRNELITLLLAGHETTANLMTWCLYELAKQPELQENIYQEVGTLDLNNIEAQQLLKLDYTYRIIQESLRLYPPVWLMERHTVSTDSIDGYRIPKGTTIIINPWVMHRHTDYWRYPDIFNPDNFLPENFKQIPDYVFIPFGKGPRMCIGMNFAIQESMIMLARIIQSFKLYNASDIEIQPIPSITLRPPKEISLKFVPRGTS